MAKTKTSEPTTGTVFQRIPYGLLIPDPDNVRDHVGDVTELAASIASSGLLQPLLVRPLEDGTFGIIAGHRRHAAIGVLRKKNGALFAEVDCMVNHDHVDENQRVIDQLVENMQRVDLGPWEESKAFFRLTKVLKVKQAELAKRLGRSPSYISDRLTILTLPDGIPPLVGTDIPVTAAVKLAGLKDEATILKLFKARRWDDQSIAGEAKTLNANKLLRQFQAAFDAAGVPFTQERPKHLETMVLAEFEIPEEFEDYMGTLAQVPDNATAYIQFDTWRGTCKTELRRPSSVEEQAEIKARREADMSERQREIQAEREEREAAERASWTPEFAAWKAECARIKEQYDADLQTFLAADAARLGAWALSLQPKTVASWALRERAENIYARDISKAFPDAAADVAVWLSTSTANLAAGVAVSMLNEADDGAVGKEIEASLATFTLKHPLEKPAELVYPRQGGSNPDGDEVVSADEQAAIDAELEAARFNEDGEEQF